ncbi:hypothetical protein KGA66_17555 [Actinocrinis puniceicyclus]|uniref:Uncharacterized protein n=1 Tax=Actinocrinis puniceicyclus TaxID=977794 RepID=A0A8J8BD43_9ACTN|nr:hypothetical protein [Actinocrinis puniceicyclus]MBS2964868.1 hypothetical protein [Actinocrinis puniceicyclus]
MTSVTVREGTWTFGVAPAVAGEIVPAAAAFEVVANVTEAASETAKRPWAALNFLGMFLPVLFLRRRVAIRDSRNIRGASRPRNMVTQGAEVCPMDRTYFLFAERAPELSR